MALQATSFITGTIGNVIHYEMNGKFYVRSRPSRVKRTVNMRKRSGNFGLGAVTGKLLRAGFGTVLTAELERESQARFGGAIAKWLGTALLKNIPQQEAIAVLEDFNFNESTGLRERCKVQATTSINPSGRVVISLPAFVPSQKIAAPSSCTSVQLNIAVSCCHVAEKMAGGFVTHMVNIPYNDQLYPAMEIELMTDSSAGRLIVAAASLIYHLENGKKEQRPVFMPVGIIKAMYLPAV
jgi:hypothetical protein